MPKMVTCSINNPRAVHRCQITKNELGAIQGEMQERVDRIVDRDQKPPVPDDNRAKGKLQNSTPDDGAHRQACACAGCPTDGPGQRCEHDKAKQRMHPLPESSMVDERRITRIGRRDGREEKNDANNQSRPAN